MKVLASLFFQKEKKKSTAPLAQRPKPTCIIAGHYSLFSKQRVGDRKVKRDISAQDLKFCSSTQKSSTLLQVLLISDLLIQVDLKL
ncbi:hypothetical protein QVD17_05549 [Tagetes erecta]|uniref:Uncharacterized protein n=1 Tax=Tagetes erecta TaxID=13708 RepID=A0AAD8PB86_TARER|nr:hypothetical protein QVD17_05549 [Tagetes erecta]